MSTKNTTEPDGMEEFKSFEGLEGELIISFDWKGEEFQIGGLTPEHTCNDLLNKVAQELNGYNTKGKKEYGKTVFDHFEYIVEKGEKRLLGDSTLKSKGMEGGNVYVTVFLDADGGSTSLEKFTIDTETRNITFKNHSQIPKATGKCIIYGDKDELCAKMTECGCLVSPSGMRGIINFVLKKNKFTRIYCPTCYHSKKKYIFWSYEKCLYIADIKGESKKIISKVFHRRYQTNSGKFKICPFCKARNKKKNNVTKYRINCGSCKKDFCFRCEKQWKSWGFLVCGNNKCPTVQKQQLLLNCKSLSTKDKRSWILHRKDIKEMPSRRACPKCYNLTMHRQACPHIKCTACGIDFCWICLTDDYKGIKKPHSWGTCKFHPKQRLN